MLHANLFVFDIETIPDADAAVNLVGISEDADVFERRTALEDYHLEITDGKNAFLRQPFQKVAAISFLTAGIERVEGKEHYVLKEVRSGGNEDSNEEELVAGFFQYLQKNFSRLVSYNGRSFDLPVLKYRAMKYGVSASWFHESGDKWNNYTSRYSLDWHCDLLEALSDFGASARVKLNEVCSAIGLPGKFGVDGSKVTDLYDGGKVKEIRDYCETDVLNTYLVYLRYMQHKGSITKQSHNESIEQVLQMIDRDEKEKPYLKEFKDAWHDACKGRFLL